MNMRTVILFMLTLVILGTPDSLAKPEYNTSFNTIYSNGSCGTCHVNGASDGPRTAYGTLFENQPNHAADAIGSLRTIGAPPATTPTLTPIAELTAAATATPTATQTLTPIATLTPTATTTPTVTTVSATATPKAHGLGIVASMAGLFACALLVKRKNR